MRWIVTMVKQRYYTPYWNSRRVPLKPQTITDKLLLNNWTTWLADCSHSVSPTHFLFLCLHGFTPDLLAEIKGCVLNKRWQNWQTDTLWCPPRPPIWSKTYQKSFVSMLTGFWQGKMFLAITHTQLLPPPILPPHHTQSSLSEPVWYISLIFSFQSGWEPSCGQWTQSWA